MDIKDKWIKIRSSQTERDILKHYAFKYDKTVSQFIREAIELYIKVLDFNNDKFNI